MPPLDFRDIDQPQIDFVHQSCGLQRVLLPFAFHMAASHAAQFFLNLRGQPIERGRIARRPGFQQIGDFRVPEKSVTPMAAFGSPFRLYRRQEIILPEGNMKSIIGATAACLLIAAGSQISARAATIPFTFAVTYDSFLGGVPSATNLTVPGMTTGSGSFTPFGSAIYSETGTVTFAMLPGGGFAPSTISANFTASFNGGVDTLTGIDFHVAGVSETLTILGGTGIFKGATGFAPATAVVDPPFGDPAPTMLGPLLVLAADKSPLPD